MTTISGLPEIDVSTVIAEQDFHSDNAENVEVQPDVETELVAVGTVAHVLRRSFHSFYDSHDDSPCDESTCAVSTAYQPATTALNAGNELHKADTSCAVERHDISAPTTKIWFAEAFAHSQALRKTKITSQLNETTQTAKSMLAYLEKKYDEAKDHDKKVAYNLSQIGLIVKAQIPMQPSTLDIQSDELKKYDSIGDSLLIADTILSEYYEKRNERSGNDTKSVVQYKNGAVPIAMGYMNTTQSTSIRKEITVENYQDRIFAIRKMEKLQKQHSTPHTPSKKFVSEHNQVHMKSNELRRNNDILQRMEKKLDFLKNPRYLISNKEKQHSIIAGNNNQLKVMHETSETLGLVAIPDPVLFTDYDAGGFYEQIAYIRNNDSLSRRVRILPPATTYFCLSSTKYPQANASGLVAPGMSVQLTIQFSPDARSEFKDHLTIHFESTDGGKPVEFHLQLLAQRPPPVLTIPTLLRAKHTLVGGTSETIFDCRNTGGRGEFWIMGQHDWEVLEQTVNVEQFVASEISCKAKEPTCLTTTPSDPLTVGSFKLTPTHIKLYEGDSVSIKLTFCPTFCGERKENIVLICDNCLVRTFTLVGRGCQVETCISSVNDREVDTDIPHIGVVNRLVFNELAVNDNARKTFEVSNMTPIDLKYSWKAYTVLEMNKLTDSKTKKNRSLHKHELKEENSKCELCPYTIDPPKGVLLGSSISKFNVIFSPTQAGIYSYNAILYIHDIPAVSMPGNCQLDLLKKSFQSASNASEPTPVQRRHEFSMECLSIALEGTAKFGSFEISPQLIQLSASVDSFQPLRKSKMYTTQVTLQNNSNAAVQFVWNLQQVKRYYQSQVKKHTGVKSSLCLDNGENELIEIPNTHQPFALTVNPLSGSLLPYSHLQVSISFTPYRVGSFSITLPCCIPSTNNKFTTLPLFRRCIRLEGVVDSASATLLSKEIDFGLVLINEEVEKEIEIQNLSHTTEANWTFQHFDPCTSLNSHSRNPHLGNEHTPFQRSNSNVSTISGATTHRSMSSLGLSTDRTTDTSVQRLPKATIMFFPESGSIEPGGTTKVRVKCLAGTASQRFRAIFCCKLAAERNFDHFLLPQPTYAISARAEIQCPNVYLTPTRISLGTTYIGVAVYTRVTLINLSNLPAAFKFRQPSVSTINTTSSDPNTHTPGYVISFDTFKGVLASKESRSICITYVPKHAGTMSILIGCTVQGLSAPLAVELSTVNKGITLTYELLQQETRANISRRPIEDITENFVIPKSPKEIAYEQGIQDFTHCDLEPDRSPFQVPNLDFGSSIQLCERRNVYIVIRNFSGIEACVSVTAKTYKGLDGLQLDSKASDDSKSASTSRSKAHSVRPSTISHKRLLLNNIHEELNRFQSKGGTKYLKLSKQDEEDRNILGLGKGMALQAYPADFQIPPWEQQVVCITCYNNMPGMYTDQVIVRPKGATPAILQATANVVGTPLVLERNCVGLYFNRKQLQNCSSPENLLNSDPSCDTIDEPTLCFGQFFFGSSPVSKVIRVKNCGPTSAILSWRLVEFGKEDERVSQNLPTDSMDNACGNIENVEDEVESKISTFPFQIEPDHELVPKFSTSSFKITYFPPASNNSSNDTICSEQSGCRIVLFADAQWIPNDQDSDMEVEGLGKSIKNNGISPLDKKHRHHHMSKRQRRKAVAAAGKACAAVRAVNYIKKEPNSQLSTARSKSPDTGLSFSYKCLKVTLVAEIINPELTLNHAKRPGGKQSHHEQRTLNSSINSVLDPASEDQYQIKFTTWSTIQDSEHTFLRKEFYLSNNFTTSFTFRLETTGPFTVFKADSIAPRHPLSATGMSSLRRPSEGESHIFTLPPGMSVRLDVRFQPVQTAKPGEASIDEQATLKNLKLSRVGELLIRFTNGCTQRLRLLGEILRPIILLSPSIYNFGRVHLSQKRYFILVLSNPTIVPAAFKIHHTPFQIVLSRLQQRSQNNTSTNNTVDDPSVFQFSCMEGVISGPTMSLCTTGGKLPQEGRTIIVRPQIDTNIVSEPMSIQVCFQPKMTDTTYKSRFRVSILHGVDSTFVVEGKGHLEEQDLGIKQIYVEPADRPFVPMSALTHSNDIL